ENAIITRSGESSGRGAEPCVPLGWVGTKPWKSAADGGLTLRPLAASARRSGLPARGAHAASSAHATSTARTSPEGGARRLTRAEVLVVAHGRVLAGRLTTSERN